VADKILLTSDDAYLFLVSAVRYALGRKTYIVGWTCEQVRKIAPKLSPSHIDVIIKDIMTCEDYGHDFDKQEWLSLLRWLQDLRSGNTSQSTANVFRGAQKFTRKTKGIKK